MLVFPGVNPVTTPPTVATPIGNSSEPAVPVMGVLFFSFFFALTVRASVPSSVRQYELVGAKIEAFSSV